MDTIGQATRLALTFDSSYNPGMYITIDGTPLTIRGTLSQRDINAKTMSKILKGGRGNHSDYAGFIFLAFHANDPDSWADLFVTPSRRLSYGDILHRITGIPLDKASSFVSATEKMFGGDNPDHPVTQEKVLRSLLPF
jgi:hypothetical protein